ncbi:MAG: hypothetical protein JW915_19810 [Chitinispirillaceae bacterium]|nr:hypothetical protein [Chitinispirillaceae bacterium]
MMWEVFFGDYYSAGIQSDDIFGIKGHIMKFEVRRVKFEIEKIILHPSSFSE